MTPAGPGQRTVLQTHYAKVGNGPVAYLDETYHVANDGRSKFYVIAAVVVLEQDRDELRSELDHLVPGGWWHTTEQLRDDSGRTEARQLLKTFQVPEETCVIVEKASVATGDKDGMQAREAALGRLLTAVHHATFKTHPPVNLAVLEEQREGRKNNADRATRKKLIAAGAIAQSMAMVMASPGSEHLLWLPDLVCSAYRQKIVHGAHDLFDEIQAMTHVVQMP